MDSVSSQIYTTIWEQLQSSAALTTSISERNWISYLDNDENPRKPGSTSPAGYPLLELRPGEGASGIQYTSDSMIIEQFYLLDIKTGDLRLANDDAKQGLLFPLKENVLVAMLPLLSHGAFTASAYGRNFSVAECSISSFDQLVEDTTGKTGWSVVFTIRVLVNIDFTELVE